MATIAYPSSARPDEQGFTLIEMLVALAVFSIAALALLRLDGYAVATTADLDARSMAELVVDNQAALIATDPAPPDKGDATLQVTNGGRRFTVHIRTAPTVDRRLVRVDLLAVEQGGVGRAGRTLVKQVQ
ncbi:hypothetical protein GCM10023219_15610 [Stakelama sediminis]|uniref:Type II secretion system protein I n=1 Tax=Stakelama sediminis TaxID=463200 RepID=A0A840YXM5_9SPHN|nr:type II secretion system minor pseudopilin GspI [Stakelama sediminis]MBB5718290.1 general secretion pathway protein I [Stakelama sediminis]